MNSPFANLFLALQQRITAEVPAIAYIDLDYGQLETRERPAVAFPCVLINFDRYSFTELLSNVQQAAGTLTIKLATDPYTSSSSITPDDYKEAALTILELEQDLFRALHGWKPVPGAALVRTAYAPDNRRPGLRVQQISFAHSFQDYAAGNTAIPHPRPDTNIVIEL